VEEYLQVVLSELEVIKQDFEKRNHELEKKIEQLEEEKMYLKLDVDVQKMEAEKQKKGKNKAEEDLDSLKIDYKRMRISMRTAGLGKTSEQWQQEIQEERTKANQWKRKLQEAQAQREAIETSLSEAQSDKEKLKAKVVELEKTLYQYRNRNSVAELRTSLEKIKCMKGNIEELENALQSCRLRVELLEANEEHWKEQLHYSQSQVRDRNYLMGEAVTQIREVDDYLQTLAV